jgi:peptidyl-Lys metalloendopeptidase
MKSLLARIYSHDTYSANEEKSLIFGLVNNTGSPIYILKWNTPLEGLKSDCLEVEKNGKTLPYKGSKVTRGTPSPLDFISLAPGGSITQPIDLDEGYDLSRSGKYLVRLKSRKLRYLHERPTTPSITTVFPGKTSNGAASPRRIPFTHRQASFSIMPGKMGTMPRQSPARQLMAAAAAELPALSIIGTVTDDRKAAIQAAHANAYDQAVQALNRLNNGPDTDYQQWFGTFDQDRFDTVKTNFQKIVRDFEQISFQYDVDGANCQPDWYGNTVKGEKKIVICKLFWDIPSTGQDSQAGKIIHEHSHSSARTDDVYPNADAGQTAEMAATNPDGVIWNANSYEYYAGG